MIVHYEIEMSLPSCNDCWAILSFQVSALKGAKGTRAKCKAYFCP